MPTYRFLRFPGGKMRAFTMSYDDGVGTDLCLMDIMREYGLKGTFNLNSRFFATEDLDVAHNPTGRLSLAQVRDCYRDFEVATHGADHPFYRDLPSSAAVYDIVKDRENLENIFGRIIRGHAYPNGAYTAETMEAFRLSGILYARATGSTHSFRIPDNFLDYHPSAHHDDADIDRLMEDFFTEPRYLCEPRLFCLWGHSYEFENNGNWDRIRHIAATVGGKDNVYYAGMEEIFSYIAAYRALVFSMDSNKIHNPTATPIWLELTASGQNCICLGPGETVNLAADTRRSHA